MKRLALVLERTFCSPQRQRDNAQVATRCRAFPYGMRYYTRRKADFNLQTRKIILLSRRYRRRPRRLGTEIRAFQRIRDRDRSRE